MRVLIVDDEPPARARLRRLLAIYPHIDVAGEAGDAAEALAQVAALAPDLLLLDVQMPGASGLELAASLPEPAPRVVFVTAYDRYALPAFDAAALDYLLKPVDPARLARSVARWTPVVVASGAPAAAGPALPPPQRLLIADRGRTLVIETAGILRLEAADNYVELHTREQGRPLMRRTLAALLADLGPRFVRIHRRHAVALEQARTLRPGARGDAWLALADGTELPVSRAWRAALTQALEQAPVQAPSAAQPRGPVAGG